jgi:PhnB protein
MRIPGPNDTIDHAELQIGDSVVMLADMPAEQGSNPKSLGGTPVMICVYVDDVDRVFDRAVQAGARSLERVQTKFYGDRTGTFEDPWGHHWSVMTHVEDVPPEEIARRAAAFAG